MQPVSTIPVFHVNDIDASVQFYTEVLGFAQAFRYGTYVGLRNGNSEIHICPPDPTGPGIGGGNAYIICDRVDDYFQAIRNAGAKKTTEPQDRVYGMRDFVVYDLDGNKLSFGCDNDRS